MQDTRPRLEPRPRAAASVRVEEGPTPAARPPSPVPGGAENSVQNGLHALATVVMHNVRPEASGKRLPMTLHRSAHVRKDDAASAIAHPEPFMFTRPLADAALVAFERLSDRVAKRAELLSRFLESSSYSFER